MSTDIQQDLDMQHASDSTTNNEAVSEAKICTSHLARSALAIKRIRKNDTLDISTLFERLAKQEELIMSGNTKALESMLISQAQVLQTLFYYAAEKISDSRFDAQLQTYATLSIKANQACRNTILVLNQLKNPNPATFIKQQNNAVNQQISQPADSEKIETPTNELLSLKEKPHETLDIRGTSTPSKVNSNLEAVEERGS